MFSIPQESSKICKCQTHRINFPQSKLISFFSISVKEIGSMPGSSQMRLPSELHSDSTICKPRLYSNLLVWHGTKPDSDFKIKDIFFVSFVCLLACFVGWVGQHEFCVVLSPSLNGIPINSFNFEVTRS